MTGAQAVLKAPVSIALLPNIFCQKGSFLAWCRVELLQYHTDSGEAKRMGQEKNIKGAESAERHICPDFYTPFRKQTAGSISALISRI